MTPNKKTLIYMLIICTSIFFIHRIAHYLQHNSQNSLEEQNFTTYLHSFYKNKNILVTGGSGFIGSHIAETLAHLGAQVTILDDFSTGNIKNITSFSDKITLLTGDIRSSESCRQATEKKDIIFHLAALASVPQSIKNPELCNAINVQGTKNLLDAAVKNKVSTFIFSSSAAVYGNKEGTCSEEDLPNPQSPYAQSKLEGEQLCKEYARKHSLNCGILRYFNVYGKRQNPNGAYAGVVAKFKHNLEYGKPITIFGNGKQMRDFINVSKVAEANLLTATHKSLQGKIFNIATGKSITLLELLKQLEQETNKKARNITFKPARKGDIFISQANTTKYQTFKNSLFK